MPQNQLLPKKNQKNNLLKNILNPRENTNTTDPFMDPFNEFTENDGNQIEMQQSYQSQGWQPFQARRKDRLKKLALLDTWNTLPGSQDSSQGFGSPNSATGEEPQRMGKDNVNYDKFYIPEKNRFPKITRQPEEDHVNNSIVDDLN